MDTSILATSSTMLVEAMWTRALDELQLLELDVRMEPEPAEEEEEAVIMAPEEVEELLRF